MLFVHTKQAMVNKDLDSNILYYMCSALQTQQHILYVITKVVIKNYRSLQNRFSNIN